MKKKDLVKEYDILRSSYELLLRGSLQKPKQAVQRKSWVTEPDYVGYGTKLLIQAMRDYYKEHLTTCLSSVCIQDGYVLINEVDREKLVKTYCETNGLVDNVRNILYLDNILYNILIYDAKIWSDIDHMYEGGVNYYVIRYKKSGSYSKKLAPAVRRVDRSF